MGKSFTFSVFQKNLSKINFPTDAQQKILNVS